MMAQVVPTQQLSPDPISATDSAASFPNLLAVIISPRGGASSDLQAVLREALPMAACTLWPDAQKALAQVDKGRRLHRFVAIYIFDFRGCQVGDLAEQIQQICLVEVSAELLVVADRHETSHVTASLQIAAAPDRLTILLSPLSKTSAIQTLQAIARRCSLLDASMRSSEEFSRTIKDLELQNQELATRLDVARHTARHDQLTGVLNRAGFVEELTARLVKDRQPQNVIMIDLDRFKAVNDTLGHGAGDELVKKICASISAIIPTGGVLARVGGDEFGILVEAMSDAGIENLCHQVQKSCNRSRMIAGHEVQLTASIGIARQGGDFGEVELMRQADLALHAAKRDGRNQIRIFDAAMDATRKHRLSIESRMEHGLISGQFRMVYQPIVNAEDGRLLTCEALVRWDSPEYGDVPPSEFIPIAEETGLILDLGDWICRQSLKDCRRWQFPSISINLSVRQFLRHNVGERVLRYAADADVAADRIQLELTETAIIDDVDRARNILVMLRDAGVKIALDDFGTGYSSLVYLNQFALDCIKIDKSFVDHITTDRQSAMIVASVTKLATSLGLHVVAEGVETEGQRTALIACGCQALQGYLFGTPMTAREISALFNSKSD
jgi:diguanylate cyclase (GGDEF)-like protein